MKYVLYAIIGLLALSACQPKPVHTDRVTGVDSTLQDQFLRGDDLRGTAFKDLNIDNKRLFIRYNQPVEGYTVTAVCFPWRSYDRDREHELIGKAILHFESEDNNFDIYNEYFSDSTLYYVNDQPFEDGQVLHLNYLPQKADEYLGYNSPFFFQDVDFDGVKELLVNNWRCGVRHSNRYDVYEIEDWKARLVTAPPFNEIDDSMTRFDSISQTIRLVKGSAVEAYERTYQKKCRQTMQSSRVVSEPYFELVGARYFYNNDYKEYVQQGDSLRLVRQTKGGHDDFWKEE